MKLVITTPIAIPDTPKDSYMVQITSMRGDGDQYLDFSVGPFKHGADEANLQSLLETLARAAERYPDGMFGGDTFSDVLGFNQWFGRFNRLDKLDKQNPALKQYSEEEHQTIINLSEGYRDEWPSDDYGHPFAIEDYIVVYFDETGAKFGVDFSL